MPGIPLFFVSANLVALAYALSPAGARLAHGLPLSALLLFQGFRLPLELILHGWVGAGIIPETMTWSGQNFDIVSGILAILLAPLVVKRPGLAWIFNGVGLLLLVNVARVATLSSPLPFGWGVQPPLTLVYSLPYAWIGPVCVGGALAGHVILTRALLRKGAESDQAGTDQAV